MVQILMDIIDVFIQKNQLQQLIKRDADVATGPFLLTLLLLDVLTSDKSSHSRVINVSSLAHRRAAPLNPDDIMLLRQRYSPSFVQYPHSKMANILFTRCLLYTSPSPRD